VAAREEERRRLRRDLGPALAGLGLSVGIRAALADVADIEVVAEAVDGEDAYSAATASPPDVVLMDLHMPGMNGIEATRRLVAADLGIKVLVLTMFEDDESVFAAVRAGASGYLVKGAAQEQIVRAIRAVAGGDVIFGTGVAERVIAFFAASGRIGSRAGRQFPELTERELEILELIARGLNNSEIARRLVVSDKTVRNPRVQRFHQAARSGPSPGDRASPRVRAGRL
jgi:DNA-binding NarL/FixJ family response regulator